MKKESVKKNFIYQILYQFVILVLPLLISPYLTRVLGDENLGIYTFTFSIAYYFVILAMLGISRHGQRVISSRRDNEIALRKTFWSLYLIHLFISIVSLICYLIFVLVIDEYKTIYLIQIIYVASALFDVTWLFYGLEIFKSVVIKNLIVKILEAAFIFIFVKSDCDLIPYTIIMSCSLFLSQILLIPKAIKLIKPIKLKLENFKEHFVPLFMLFIVVLSATLYTVFDKTLLGWLSTKENVAYYEYSNKIINIPKTIISVISTVLFPRICFALNNNRMDSVKKYYRIAVAFTYFIAFGSIIGLICVSDLLSILYYGENFATCGPVIKALTPAILIIGFGDIIRTQFIVPLKKDFAFMFITIGNAIINVTLSTILIGYIGIYGAIIGTLMAEIFGLVLQVIISRKYMDFKFTLLGAIPYLIGAAFMYFSIEFIKLYLNSSVLDLLVQIIVGCFSYVFGIIIVYLILPNRKYYINIVKNVFKRKEKMNVNTQNIEN